MRVVRICLYYLCTLVLVSLIALNVCSATGSSFLGWRVYRIGSGSMLPLLPVHEVIITKAQSDYGVGDIITYQSGDHTLVTHRIVRMDDDQIVTRGDANNLDDAPITQSQVLGRLYWHCQAATLTRLIIALALVLAVLILTHQTRARSRLRRQSWSWATLWLVAVLLGSTRQAQARFCSPLAGSASLPIASWGVNVAAETPATPVSVLIGHTVYSYPFQVSSNSEVEVDYQVLLTGVPAALQVRLDGQAPVATDSGGIYFAGGHFNAGETTPHPHTVTLSAPLGATAGSQQIGVKVLFTQTQPIP